MSICVCEKHSSLSVHVRANRFDPTRTLFLRDQFVKDMVGRFRKLRGFIFKTIVEEDVFALKPGSGGFATQASMNTPGKYAFDFPRSGDKVSAFMRWLRKQEEAGLLEITQLPQLGTAIEEVWANKYIQSAYQRGILRARAELVKAKFKVPPIGKTGGIDVAFNQPFHIDRVGLLYTRTFNDLRGITDQMDTQISRVLSQGMAEGRNPREIAKLLNRTITGPSGDLGLTDILGRFIPAERRAEMLARTEVIRAHHSATIQEYKNWAVEGVIVKAEFRTAGDERVCPECEALEGKVYNLDDIENVIPVHPQCRCITIPLEVGKEKE